MIIWHSVIIPWIWLGNVTRSSSWWRREARSKFPATSSVLNAVAENGVAICISETPRHNNDKHYVDVIMSALASQFTSLTIVYSAVYSNADQRKHQSSASLAFVWGIHCRPVNSPHKWPVTRKMFPFDDVIMSHGSVISWAFCCIIYIEYSYMKWHDTCLAPWISLQVRCNSTKIATCDFHLGWFKFDWRQILMATSNNNLKKSIRNASEVDTF